MSADKICNCQDSSPEVIIKPLERIAKERQAHLRALVLLCRHCRLSPSSLSSPQQRSVVGLVDLVSGEVGCVDVRCQSRLERCPNPTEAIKLDTTEERMALDFMSTAPTKTILRVADETKRLLAHSQNQTRAYQPPDQGLGLHAQLDVVGEVERLPPVHNFAVRVMTILSTEGRPSNQTFEHNCPE